MGTENENPGGIMPKWFSTKFPGVRYREHKTRKHGIRKDRYFVIRYQAGGLRKEEAVGWWSEGWNGEKAALLLSDLKNSYRQGKGEERLAERRLKVKAEQEKKKLKEITFKEVFEKQYFPHAKLEKSFKSYDREKGLFYNWINPVIGGVAFPDIAPIHIEKIKKNLMDAQRSPRSIQYCLAVTRQIFNYAFMHGLFNGDNPVKKVKQPKVDNKRLRFLTVEEADLLLSFLKIEAPELREMALISLHCGLRASEIFSLSWIDININQDTIVVRDPKIKTRVAHMTETIRNLFLSKDIGKPTDLIFPAADGQKRKEVSTAFRRIVKKIGFNDGIKDRRNRVVFHTLRHTYASWLVQEGESLYTVKELMGHSTLAMTERYSHLAPGDTKKAVKKIENKLNKGTVVSFKKTHKA